MNPSGDGYEPNPTIAALVRHAGDECAARTIVARNLRAVVQVAMEELPATACCLLSGVIFPEMFRPLSTEGTEWFLSMNGS